MIRVVVAEESLTVTTHGGKSTLVDEGNSPVEVPSGTYQAEKIDGGKRIIGVALVHPGKRVIFKKGENDGD